MKIEGAMTAIVTPMRDGSVDYDAFAALIEDQIQNGIDGIVAVGTTGESATLTVPEHKAVIQFTVERVDKRVPVIAGAGGNATAEAIELTRAAARAGADATLQVVPYYNKPTQEGMYQHFKAIADAEPLPVVLYNVPGRTSCDMLPETVARLARLDNVVAIKEATGNMHRAAQIIEQCPDDFAVLSGDDFTTFTLYALGGRGVISVVSNVMPGTMARMWDAASKGDWDAARACHYDILDLTELLFVEANPIPVKECLVLMELIGPELRLPMVRCSEPLRERLRACLADKGLLP